MMVVIDNPVSSATAYDLIFVVHFREALRILTISHASLPNCLYTRAHTTVLLDIYIYQ